MSTREELKQPMQTFEIDPSKLEEYYPLSKLRGVPVIGATKMRALHLIVNKATRDRKHVDDPLTMTRAEVFRCMGDCGVFDPWETFLNEIIENGFLTEVTE